MILALKVALLMVEAALAIHFGPFNNGDAWQAVLTGMVLVAAMAIQNTTHRIQLGSAPPSTLMTGTTTQIMIDLEDMVQPQTSEGSQRPSARLLPCRPTSLCSRQAVRPPPFCTRVSASGALSCRRY
jgi:uncharacterized membrane protein YoaK (UPF0700 family)